jgi:hypothetical protein
MGVRVWALSSIYICFPSIRLCDLSQDLINVLSSRGSRTPSFSYGLGLAHRGVTTQFPRLARDCSLSGKVLDTGHCLPARNLATLPRLSSPRGHSSSYI